MIFRFCNASFRDLATTLQELLLPPLGSESAAPVAAIISYKPRFPRLEQEFFDALGPRQLECGAPLSLLQLPDSERVFCGADDADAEDNARGVNADIQLLHIQKKHKVRF